jgi:uncharacterized protein (DUF736 family)
MQLGHFTKDDDGTLVGRVSNPGSVTIPLKLKQAIGIKGREYYRAYTEAGGFNQEIGYANTFMSRAGNTYIRLTIDSPIFPVPLNANLYEDRVTGIYDLVWDRPEDTTISAYKNKSEPAVPMAGFSTPSP